MSRVLAGLANVVLGSAALHAVAFTVTGLLWVLTGARLAQMLGTPFALLALGMSNLGMMVAVVTPRMPLRIVLPLWLLQLYLILGAMPFGVLVLVRRSHMIWPSLILLVGVAVVLLVSRTLDDRGQFGLSEAYIDSRPAFSPGRTIALVAASLTALPLGLVLYGAASTSWTLSWATAGYAGIDSSGFVVRGREFRRGDTRLVLQGMMHIGEARAYDDLYKSFGERSNTVVLTEGVDDQQDKLGRGGVGYERMAGRLGLEQQHRIEEDGFAIRNADVDVSEFSEHTLTMLRKSFGIWQAEDPARAWIEYSMEYSSADPEALYRPIYQDIVVLRNESLLEHIADAEGEFDVIIAPWGAAHMPGVQGELVELGWEPGEWSERTLWSWGTVGDALGR